jgi:VanZ family protein
VDFSRRFSIRALLAWAAFVVWIAGITILSSLPGQTFGPMPFFDADKVVHMALFALGGAAFLAGLRSILRGGVSQLAGIALGCMAVIGAADEIHQLWTPGRSGGDVGDWTADVIGAALGIACVSFLYARRTSKSHLAAPGADRAA